MKEYIGDNLEDYKFFVIQGNFVFCQVDSNRYINHCRNLYYKNFKLFNFIKVKPNYTYKILKPKNYEKMIKISEKIAKIFEFCRVDLYNIYGKIYFGEITFFPGSASKSDTIKGLKNDFMISNKWK